MNFTICELYLNFLSWSKCFSWTNLQVLPGSLRCRGGSGPWSYHLGSWTNERCQPGYGSPLSSLPWHHIILDLQLLPENKENNLKQKKYLTSFYHLIAKGSLINLLIVPISSIKQAWPCLVTAEKINYWAGLEKLGTNTSKMPLRRDGLRFIWGLEEKNKCWLYLLPAYPQQRFHSWSFIFHYIAPK